MIQGNKSGLLYVLNRDTGKPVFPVEERPVSQSDVPGELTSRTQPIPLKPPSLVPQALSADEAGGRRRKIVNSAAMLSNSCAMKVFLLRPACKEPLWCREISAA